jgi:hypothetical protein
MLIKAGVERLNYYSGYLAALQDIIRDVDTGIVDKLTLSAVRDIIRETQLEDRNKKGGRKMLIKAGVERGENDRT